MGRTIKARKNPNTTPKRNKAKRKQSPYKAPKQIIEKIRNKRKSLGFKQMNANIKKQTKQRKSGNPYSVTPRTSRRLAIQRQNFCKPVMSSYSPLVYGRKTRKTSPKPQTPTDTIVIEDTDEENEANMSNNEPTPGLVFYEDRSPGLKQLEIPLYKTDDNVANSGDASPDASVIVLDCTLDKTADYQLSNIDHAQPQPSCPETAQHNNNCLPTANVASSSTANVQQVIDLSDDTEDESPTPSYIPVNCVPLGYDFAKPKPKIKQSPKKPPWKKNGISNGAEPNATILSASVPKRDSGETQKKRMIIIDGNNVAYGHLNGKMFSVKGLDLCITYFQKLGHEVVAVVPQYKLKRTQSTNQERLEQLHRQGDVILAPSKNLPGQYSSSYDDRLILSVAEKFDGVIVSNDNFRDLLDCSPSWRRIIETRVVGYTWVKDCFFLPDDPYGRQGPSLKQILNGSSA